MNQNSSSSRRSWDWTPPILGLDMNKEEEQHWRRLDDYSVNAVSLGFVATAILISMFLLMAIFERFMRPRWSDPAFLTTPNPVPGDAHIIASSLKSGHPSPTTSYYANGVSVLMPGQHTPTYIAHPAPAPVPCPPERISWPSHHQNLHQH